MKKMGDKLIEIVTDIKEAVVGGKTVVTKAISEKGIDISSDATFLEMANNIDKIKYGNFVPIKKTSLKEIQLPKEFEGGVAYVFKDSKGNIFISHSSSNTGIWKYDGHNFIKICNIGYYWRYWFESSYGDLFVGSYLSGGILRWSGDEFLPAIESGLNNFSQWFEDSDNNLFVVRGNNQHTISKWNGLMFIPVSPFGVWSSWFEDSQGNVFVCNQNSGDYGVFKWQDGFFTKVYSDEYMWNYWKETSDGDLFLTSFSNDSGILKWNGVGFEKIYLNGSRWNLRFEDSQGNTFFSGNSSNANGILRWDGHSITEVYNSGYNWQYWFEDSQGNVFVSGSSGSSGILKWNGEYFEKVYSGSSQWRYWFEDSQKKLFVSGGNSILKWEDNSFYVFHRDNWQCWFEDDIGGIFATSYTSNLYSIIKLEGTTIKTIYNNGYFFNLVTEDGYFVPITSAGHNIVCVKDGFIQRTMLNGGIQLNENWFIAAERYTASNLKDNYMVELKGYYSPENISRNIAISASSSSRFILFEQEEL